MNLRRATFLAMLGLGYTVLHKLAYGLVPSLKGSPAGRGITSVLSLVAALTLILFAYQFLKELSPRDKRLRYSLVSMIVFTGLAVASKLPVGPMSDGGLGHRLLLGISALCNSLAILTFLVSFGGLITRSSPLWVPVRGSIWADCATVTLGLVSIGYLTVYITSGREVEPSAFLQPLAMVVFLLTHGMTIWFLIRFWRIGSHADLRHDEGQHELPLDNRCKRTALRAAADAKRSAETSRKEQM
jgi:hypothetical protein